MNIRDLTIPILQAPIGSIATTELAAAVSNAGGMGSLAMTWTKPKIAAEWVEQLKAKTDKPFFINFVLTFPPKAFDAVLEAGAPAITLSWGHAPALIERAHKKGVVVGVQIGTVEGAKRAISDGADFIITQGIEAGGHVQSTSELATLLPEVVEQALNIPVVATGGLADGTDISWALKQGATAAMLGTRFVATLESQAHEIYKEAIVKAKGDDTAYTICFDGGWPYAAHRVLRNETLEKWEAAGCPPVGNRPGEGDIIAREVSGAEVRRYDDSPALHSMSGDVMDTCLYAGLSVDKIFDTPLTKDLMLKLWDQCQQVGKAV